MLYWRAEYIQDEKLWSRLIYVAGALGGLTTTAVGWLFGREVHRAAAEHATKEAGIARSLARNARKDADAGAFLARAIKATPEPATGSGDAAAVGSAWALSASHLAQRGWPRVSFPTRTLNRSTSRRPGKAPDVEPSLSQR